MSNNPFQSPGNLNVPPVKYPPPRFGRTEVSYSEAFNYAMTNPNWLVNCILLGLPGLIPGIGPLLAQLICLGYLFGDYDTQLRHGATAPSDVRFEKFGDYLHRGIMPLIAAILLGLVTTFLIIIFFAPPLFLGLALMESTDGLSIILVALSAMGYVAGSIALNFFVSPLMFRAAVTNRFEEVMNFSWALSMVKALWGKMLLAAIVVGFMSMGIMLLGMLVCGIGMIPAQGFVGYLAFHMQRQLYEIYVTQGGEPIPLADGVPLK